MEFPTLKQGSTSRELLTAFPGYSGCPRPAAGAFAAMENCSGEDYPLLATRRPRGVYARPGSCTGLTAKDGLCWVDGSDFVVNGYPVSLGLTPGEKQLVSMGAYVVIFPDKKYINTADLTDFGNLEAECTAPGPVRFTPVLADGTPLIPAYTQPEEPKEPENGALWLDNSSAVTLLQWSAGSGMWVSVDTTLVKITAPGLGRAFRPGDGVQLSGGPEGVATQGVIAQCGEDFVTLPGLLAAEQTQTAPVTLGRYLPNMDFVIHCGNRLWGCRYGTSRTGAVVNEIYASKLGDFRNWSCFQGVSTDSYALSLGTDGPFTGAAEFLGCPLFFREGCIHKIYGTTPASFRLQTTQCPGVQLGSSRSLARIGQTLFYKSPEGVCAYDGAVPVEVSQSLGKTRYTRAAAGALGSRYYISMQETGGGYHLFVYDAPRGLWHREDSSEIHCFCPCRGDLFYVNQAGEIISVSGQGEPEGPFQWYLETGPLGGLSPDCKQLSRLSLKVELGGRMALYVRYDRETAWLPLARIQATELKTLTLPVAVRRCDHLRLRLEGTGPMRLHALAKTMEWGSDV